MTIRGTLTVIRVKQPTNDNSLVIEFSPSSCGFVEKLYFCRVVLEGSVFQVKSAMSAVLSIIGRIAQFHLGFFRKSKAERRNVFSFPFHFFCMMTLNIWLSNMILLLSDLFSCNSPN